MKIFVVVLLVVLLISSGACISKPKELQIAEPPRVPIVTQLGGFHEDTIYGFSLHYPQSWISEGGDTEGSSLTIHNSNYSCSVQVFVEELSQSMDVEDYSANAISKITQNLRDFQLLAEGRVQMDDEVGYEYAFEGVESDNPLKANLICLIRENQAFTVLAAAQRSIYDLLEDSIANTVYSFRLQEPFSLTDIPRDESLVLCGVSPITLDPAVMLDADSAMYILQIFSGLITLNQDLEIIPDIAESWDISKDGLVYTFYLIPDTKFHNGKTVTADDFKYSIERVCDPEIESQVASSYLGDIIGVREKLAGEAADIAGVVVVDDHTLQITIDAPKAHFLSKLLYSTAFVVDKENVNSGEEWWRHPNGTGPFKVKNWKNDEFLVLERNELYNGDQPDLQNVIFRLWSGRPMTMYEQGEIDITWVSGANIQRVLDPANPLNDELIVTPEISINYIGFNVTEQPFDDLKVRQAFCHAIDKDKIIEALFKNLVQRADGILPPSLPGYNEDIQGLDFDPGKARELILQSSYGSASSLPPVVYTTSGRGYVSVLTEALADMWREYLDVEVTIRQIDPEIYAYTIKQEKDQLFDIGWLADYPDPQNFLDILFHSESKDNVGGYRNPQIDDRLEAARAETDAEVRREMYRKIEELLVEGAACLPLYFSEDYTLVKPYVKGFIGIPMPIPWLKYISIDLQE